NGMDETGQIINMTISEHMRDNIDVYVVTISSEDDDDTNNLDDLTDSDDNDEESIDDGSNDTQDSKGDDKKEPDEVDDDTDTNDSDEIVDEDPTEDPEDESSEEESVSAYLVVEKRIWNERDNVWQKNHTIEISESVRFNISVDYHTSSFSEVHILDSLPNGLQYNGNATINGNISFPFIDHTNHTLLWKIPIVSNMNRSVYIEYDMIILTRTVFQNNVTVFFLHNNDTMFVTHANSTLIVCGELQVTKMVRKPNDSSWYPTVSTNLGETVRFNISVFYNGSHTVSNIQIRDTLLSGFSNFRNVTFNGVPTLPSVTTDNETIVISWINLTLLPNQKIVIEYDVNLTKEGSIHNNVTVIGEEFFGKKFNETAFATVTSQIPLYFMCEKTVKANNLSWQNSIEAYVGDTATFKVIISNVSMSPMSPISIKDMLPSSLEYETGSSVLYFRNDTYEKEPKFNQEQNIYYWDKINKIINTSDFNVSDTLTLQYNVTIIEEGTHINEVCASGELYETCDMVTTVDFATINALFELTVDIIVTEPAYTEIPVEISADVSGGKPPYTCEWDVNNDGVIDNDSRNLTKIWDTAGNYPLSITVTDARNVSVTNTTLLSIKELDTTPPIITISSPTNAIYIKNKPLVMFFRPIVFGSIDINITVEDEESLIDIIEIYLNGQLVKTSQENTADFLWDETVFGRQILTVKVINEFGLEAILEKTVWKFF
ncbi:MAG: PKD domain-containing protein, partial [Candidatus Thermoplasmatota archaeon]|nr:PKD domain-containing protein [Candidatus Thermoplasmatota archaeon]